MLQYIFNFVKVIVWNFDKHGNLLSQWKLANFCQKKMVWLISKAENSSDYLKQTNDKNMIWMECLIYLINQNVFLKIVVLQVILKLPWQPQ